MLGLHLFGEVSFIVGLSHNKVLVLNGGISQLIKGNYVIDSWGIADISDDVSTTACIAGTVGIVSDIGAVGAVGAIVGWVAVGGIGGVVGAIDDSGYRWHVEVEGIKGTDSI